MPKDVRASTKQKNAGRRNLHKAQMDRIGLRGTKRLRNPDKRR